MGITELYNSDQNDDNTSNLQFEDLPTDILLHIFKFIDIATLYALSQCCKNLYNVICEDSVWTARSKGVLITNQHSERILKISAKYLKAKQKCRISVNWKLGSYVEKCFSTRIKYMPWIILEKDRLWVSRGERIYGLARQGSNVVWNKPKIILYENANETDVCRFVSSEGNIISGSGDGSICIWSGESGKLIFKKEDTQGSREVRCVDCAGNIVISGSRDSLLKVWRYENDELSNDPLYSLDMLDGIWSTALDPTGSVVCCGTSGHSVNSSVKLFDLESLRLKQFGSSKIGVAIFDIKWESANTFLTCGYDSMLRLWDKRCETSVLSWMDPFDAVGYCLATDNRYSVLCGTAQNGRVQLWDLRSRISVQSFFCKSPRSSPVYSLAFDPCCMFAALDSSLNVLDFSGDLKTRNDYRSTWSGCCY